jgi:tryptophan halogenase
MKIAIIGGGGSGWMAASWISKLVPNSNITVIESDKTPRLGVGESVTPHVVKFLEVLGIDEQHFMYETGSIYKYGNNFVNWAHGQGESEHFYFSWNKNRQQLLQSPYNGVSWNDHLAVTANETRLTDYWLELFLQGKVDRQFSKTFAGWQNFTDTLKAPYIGNTPYLKNDMNWSYHINAEKFADYLRDNCALPRGVQKKVAHIDKVVVEQQEISKLIFDTGEEFSADLYLDCSGLTRLLMKNFELEWKWYKDMPCNAAMVCQVDYTDQAVEMKNYSQSLAMNEGWKFIVTLYHRMGQGYVYSTDFSSDEKILAEFKPTLTKPRFEPKLMKWDKKRLVNASFGNVCAIGLAIGFIEPMEANMIGTTINSIWTLTNLMKDVKSVKEINWKEYNRIMSENFDNVADFIHVHYTLTQREDTEFWRAMKDQGVKLKHDEFVIQQYIDAKNTMSETAKGTCFFPDYMWIELAASWGLDLSKWPRKVVSKEELELAELHFAYLKKNIETASKQFPSYLDYMRANIFKGLTSEQWTNNVL